MAHTIRGFRTGEPLRSQLRHPAQGPLAALVPIVGMLLGEHLHEDAPAWGEVLVIASLAVSALLAGWLLAHWLGGELQLDMLHGGYLLPTVAAGLVGSAAADRVGFPALAWGALAVGIFFWVVIFTLLLGRLAFRPPLPAPLVPTMAIIIAPPAVAGTAWFAITENRPGEIDDALAGLMDPMLLMQVGLLPRYRALPFSLGFWSFTFPSAAVGGYGMQWLAIKRPVAWEAASWAILAVITALIVAIGVRSVLLVVGGGPSARHRAERQLVDANDAVSS